MRAPWRCSNRPAWTRRPRDVPPGTLTVVMPASRLVPLEPQGSDDDRALDDLRDLLSDAVRDERVLQQFEQDGAHHGSPDVHLSAGQRGAGDGHRGDRVEFYAQADVVGVR